MKFEKDRCQSASFQNMLSDWPKLKHGWVKCLGDYHIYIYSPRHLTPSSYIYIYIYISHKYKVSIIEQIKLNFSRTIVLGKWTFVLCVKFFLVLSTSKESNRQAIVERLWVEWFQGNFLSLMTFNVVLHVLSIVWW